MAKRRAVVPSPKKVTKRRMPTTTGRKPAAAGRALAATKGKVPSTTGRGLAVTKGKGKKTGLKRQGY
jgi:hypothetical protein